MNNNKKYSINPFGEKVDKSGTLYEDKNWFYRILEDTTTKVVAIILGVLIVVSLLTLYVGNGIVASSMKTTTEKNISEYNRVSLSIVETLKKDKVVEELNRIKASTSSEEYKQYAADILSVSNDLSTNPLDLVSQDMTGEEAALASIRLIYVCDRIPKMFEYQEQELMNRCDEFNEIGSSMISNAENYNKLMDSFSGKMSWNDKDIRYPNMKDESSTNPQIEAPPLP